LITIWGISPRPSSAPPGCPSRLGLVAALADALDLLVAHELADLLHQRRLVDLVGQLGDDDRLAPARIFSTWALARSVMMRAGGVARGSRPRP